MEKARFSREGVGIPAQAHRDGVDRDPDDHGRSLPGYVLGRPEEARRGLGPPAEGVLTEGGRHIRHATGFAMAQAAPAAQLVRCRFMALRMKSVWVPNVGVDFGRSRCLATRTHNREDDQGEYPA